MKANNKKKKLLFVNGNLNIGGVEKSLITILQNIDYSKYDVDLLLLESGGEFEQEVPEQVNIVIRSLNPACGPLKEVLTESIKNRDLFTLQARSIIILRRLLGEKAYRLFRPILMPGQYDACIGFRTGLATDLTVYGVRAKKKIIWWHHGAVNVDRSYGKVAKNSDRLITVSEFCRQMITDQFPELKDKISVIPNIVDQSVLKALTEVYNPDFQTEKMNIVSVGRLSPEKRYDLAVLCAAKLREKGFSFNWYLIGDGPELSKLKQMVRDLNLDDVFHFVGKLSNPYPYVSKADLFSHPSYVESQGIAVLEALALNVPAVVMDCGGVEEFVINGQNGMVCRKDTDEFFEAMEKLVSDESFRKELKSQAQLPSGYSSSEVMSEIEKVI